MTKTGKMERLKANWKKVVLSIAALASIIYFIITGEEIDITIIQGLLK
jgi:hypothetical protein